MTSINKTNAAALLSMLATPTAQSSGGLSKLNPEVASKMLEMLEGMAKLLKGLQDLTGGGDSFGKAGGAGKSGGPGQAGGAEGSSPLIQQFLQMLQMMQALQNIQSGGDQGGGFGSGGGMPGLGGGSGGGMPSLGSGGGMPGLGGGSGGGMPGMDGGSSFGSAPTGGAPGASGAPVFGGGPQGAGGAPGASGAPVFGGGPQGTGGAQGTTGTPAGGTPVSALPLADQIKTLLNIKQEQGALMGKIAEGVKSGKITPQELGKLMQGVAKLAEATKSASSKGVITAEDAAKLGQMSMENALNTKSAFENGDKANFAALNPAMQRQGDQLGQIAQGLNNGTISNSELTDLAEEQGGIAEAETKTSSVGDAEKLLKAQDLTGLSITAARLNNPM